MVVAVSGNEARVAINGKKLLKLLGVTEEELSNPEAASIIANRLYVMSNKEREQLFNECKVHENEIVEMAWAEKEEPKTHVFRIVNPNFEDTVRSVAEIKKDLKRCKNYMQRKALEKELQIAYKNAKRNYY